MSYLGFLYFDTSALMKYLFKETGSDIVEFLIKNGLKYNFISYTSQIAIYEIEGNLERKVKQPKGHKDHISKVDYDRKLCRLRNIEQIIHIIDKRAVVGKKKFNYLDEGCKNNLKMGDARHWAAVLNYLGCRNKKDVIIIYADSDFNKPVKKYRFQKINPEKVTKKDVARFLCR